MTPRSESLTIRQASSGDLETIVTFNAALALETENRQLDLVRLREGVLAVLGNPERGFYIVAEILRGENQQPIGQIMVTFEWSDWRNGVFWWIQSVYVEPTQRRQGVFRALHNHIMRKATTDAQVCGTRLYVERGNQPAQTVYQRVGIIPSAYTMFEQDFVLSHTGSETDRTKEAP